MASESSNSVPLPPQEPEEAGAKAGSPQLAETPQEKLASPDVAADDHNLEDRADSGATNKARMFKAYPETRSLSAYMDDVISEFAAVMEARMPNMEEVKVMFLSKS